ncbi:MotA/TolQ/ExbB proton channel family protein [Phenylobacterium sp.]|uniref:MotA/TolQ/ExbB proton channel family protein n=1 Tax=Phenylobacterium sp. TaxID=1871053 RepID=UPI0035678060
MQILKRLASRAGLLAALVIATPVVAQTTAADVRLSTLPQADRLTLGGVFSHAAPTMKVVLWGLVAAIAAAIVVWILQAARVRQGRSDGVAGGVAYLSAQAAAAPLVGLFGLSYAFLSGFIGISNVRPTPNLTVLAPGLAEAMLSLGLGLLAGAIAVIGHRHLQFRLNAVGQAAPAAARAAPPSSHPARAIA